MPGFLTQAQIRDSAGAVRRRIDVEPRVGLVLGSGFSSLADGVEQATAIPFGELDHFPVSTVEGHTGRLVAGRLEAQPVVVMQGRAHYYEGYPMDRVAFPVRVMQALGIEVLIVTNAAGGLNPAFEAGDLMLITDHVNLIGMAGQNPLRGPNLEGFGPRFPDMSQAYDGDLRALARRAAVQAPGVPLKEGVYVCLAGPSFETPADVRFLRLIGADAVGMSTVPEVIAARHGGTRVLGLSGISNVAPSEGAEPVETTHAEVLEAGRVLVPRLETIIRRVLRAL